MRTIDDLQSQAMEVCDMAPLQSSSGLSGMDHLARIVNLNGRSQATRAALEANTSINCKPSESRDRTFTTPASSSESAPLSGDCVASDSATNDTNARVSAPRNKLFLKRKRRMEPDATSETTSEVTKSAKLVNNGTPRNHLLSLASAAETMALSSQAATATQRNDSNREATSTAGQAAALSAATTKTTITGQAHILPDRVVTPEVRNEKQSYKPKPSADVGPTIRPLESDYCFGPGTSRNPGNKALKHMAYYATLPFLQGKGRSSTNENLTIAKKVVHVWQGAGGRFLQSDDKSAFWLPVTDHAYIVEKIRRSIGSWKGSWRHEVHEKGTTGNTIE